MTRKIYSYPGISNGEIQIKAGKALIKVTFSNGYLDKKMNRPATYSTGDPVMQQIIENSDLFGKRIFLYKEFSDGTPNMQVSPRMNRANANKVEPAEPTGTDEPIGTAEPAPEEVIEYPEVTSFEGAVAVLKALPGVKATSLRTVESALKVAASKGISFPNFIQE